MFAVHLVLIFPFFIFYILNKNRRDLVGSVLGY